MFLYTEPVKLISSRLLYCLVDTQSATVSVSLSSLAVILPELVVMLPELVVMFPELVVMFPELVVMFPSLVVIRANSAVVAPPSSSTHLNLVVSVSRLNTCPAIPVFVISNLPSSTLPSAIAVELGELQVSSSVEFLYSSISPSVWCVRYLQFNFCNRVISYTRTILNPGELVGIIFILKDVTITRCVGYL